VQSHHILTGTDFPLHSLQDAWKHGDRRDGFSLQLKVSLRLFVDQADVLLMASGMTALQVT
jgi:hypothetical protein